VSSARLPSETDVVLIGGGPAGLVAALAARQRGFDVLVADRARAPIDKACGEGLMPDGVAALRRMGVELNAADGAPFRGIRFLDNELQVEACFPYSECGLGIRRTRLHQILVDRAQDAGVRLCWQSQVDALEPSGVRIGGQSVCCRWIVGADGFHSRVRQWIGLRPLWSGRRRIGVRQHFRVEPWTDFVEVYWSRHCQANVTPIGPDEICVAMIGTVKEVRAEDLPSLFPRLARHLQHAEPIGSRRGAITASVRYPAVSCGNVALVGDASGSVDAVTGEGLHLAFRQAEALTEAFVSGNLCEYSAAHRELERMPQIMARLLLLLDGNDRLRRLAFRGLALCPSIFSALLAFHVGTRPHLPLAAPHLAFDWGMARVNRR